MEQILLKKWRTLPPEKQQEVIDFVEFLESRTPSSDIQLSASMSSRATPLNLGEKLRKARAEIVASGIPLMNLEQLEQEKTSRRGGYQETEQ